MTVNLVGRAVAAGELLESAAISGQGLTSVFSEVARLLDGDMFQLINVTRPEAPELFVDSSCGGILADYIQSGWHEFDTWTHKAREVAMHGVLLNTELVDPSVRRRDPFFQEFCRDWEIGRFTAWTFDLCGQKWGYTLMRKPEDQLSDLHLEALRTLMPAADRASLFASAFRDNRARGLAEGLEQGGKPAIVLDHEGRVLFATPSAERLFGQGFTVRDGRLRGQTGPADGAFRRLSDHAGMTRPPMLANFSIPRPDGRRPIVAMPISVRDQAVEALPGARIVLMLMDLESRLGPPHEVLIEVFGLSPREAELAARIATGESLEDAAEHMGVKIATVRHMMKVLFSKTGTHRQPELAALLGRITAP